MKNARCLLFVVASLALTSCSTSTCPFAPASPKHGKIEHIVLAWLKQPGNAGDRAKLIAAAKSLKAQIKEVQSLDVGLAVPSDRPVVDSSFDVGLVMSFNSKADLDSYGKNPAHVKALTEVLKPLTKRMQVYDIAAQ